MMKKNELNKLGEIEKVNDFIVDQEEVIWTADKVLLNSKVVAEGDIQLIRLREGNLYVQKTNSSELIECSTLTKNALPNVGNLIHRETYSMVSTMQPIQKDMSLRRTSLPKKSCGKKKMESVKHTGRAISFLVIRIQ